MFFLFPKKTINNFLTTAQSRTLLKDIYVLFFLCVCFSLALNGRGRLRGPAAITSCCAILVTIVSQTLSCLFCGSCRVIARYVATWGIAQMCLCETKCQGMGGGGVSHNFGGVLTSLTRHRAI